MSSSARPDRGIRVFAVDDHAAVLRAVALVIDATDGFTLVGTARSGAEALAALAGEPGEQPDLVLMDVQMPGIDGIETAHRYLDADGEAVIVLMSAADLDELPRDAVTGGVAGFLPKSSLSPSTLRRAWTQAAG